MENSNPTLTGPLLALLNESRKARERRRSPKREPAQEVPEDRHIRPESIRNHFLIELEVTGSVKAAANSAGCSLEDVKSWRTSDPKFTRDFALALMAHMRAMKLMVQKLSTSHPLDSVRRDAASLLGRERQHLDADGRLDVRSWCDELHSFTNRLGLELETWDPDLATTVPVSPDLEAVS